MAWVALANVRGCVLGFSLFFIEVVLMFAEFIEKFHDYPGVKPLEQLEKELAEKVKKRPPKQRDHQLCILATTIAWSFS